MEQKRFGVNNSRIEELRLFQLALQQRRLTMPFSTRAEVFAGEEFIEKTVIAMRRKITIRPSRPPIENFSLPRQPLELIDETGLRLRINDYLNITIKFRTPQEGTRFLRALGDLDPPYSSSDSEDNERNHVPNGAYPL